MNELNAEFLARADARTAIEIARASGDDPIAWLTGNSYMPPLRDFGAAETVWQAQYDVPEDVDLWMAYAETFESECEKADVYVGTPDYDNALYAVDLRRFEHSEDEDGDDLQSEWTAKPVHVDYPHFPGYLFDCPACEHECFCTPGNSECVFEGEHNGGARGG